MKETLYYDIGAQTKSVDGILNELQVLIKAGKTMTENITELRNAWISSTSKAAIDKLDEFLNNDYSTTFLPAFKQTGDRLERVKDLTSKGIDRVGL